MNIEQRSDFESAFEAARNAGDVDQLADVILAHGLSDVHTIRAEAGLPAAWTHPQVRGVRSVSHLYPQWAREAAIAVIAQWREVTRAERKR